MPGMSRHPNQTRLQRSQCGCLQRAAQRAPYPSPHPLPRRNHRCPPMLLPRSPLALHRLATPPLRTVNPHPIRPISATRHLTAHTSARTPPISSAPLPFPTHPPRLLHRATASRHIPGRDPRYRHPPRARRRPDHLAVKVSAIWRATSCRFRCSRQLLPLGAGPRCRRRKASRKPRPSSVAPEQLLRRCAMQCGWC